MVTTILGKTVSFDPKLLKVANFTQEGQIGEKLKFSDRVENLHLCKFKVAEYHYDKISWGKLFFSNRKGKFFPKREAD